MNPLVPLLKALADESRLRILNLLFASGELCVCDIESTLGFTQTKVSRHMKYLKRAGIVVDRRHGKWILYGIASPKTEEQREMLESVRGLVASQRRTRDDANRLHRNIQNGCCATFIHVIPPENIESRSHPSTRTLWKISRKLLRNSTEK